MRQSRETLLLAFYNDFDCVGRDFSIIQVFSQLSYIHYMLRSCMRLIKVLDDVLPPGCTLVAWQWIWENEVEDDGINTLNAHTFPMHLHPNATHDNIIRSSIGKSFDSINKNDFKVIFRKCFLGKFLDLPMNNNARF